MQSSNQAEQWWSTEPFLTWARRGTSHQHRQQGQGLGKTATSKQAAGGKGSMAKAPVDHTGLLSELGRGVCAWESEQQARPLFRCPFMGGWQRRGHVSTTAATHRVSPRFTTPRAFSILASRMKETLPAKDESWQ